MDQSFIIGKQPGAVERAFTFASLSKYPLKKRLIIWTADLGFYILINLIGRTVRFHVTGWENWDQVFKDGRLPIQAFWHNRVFLATYYFRHRGIVVMTSQSMDGEYIARFIQRFGYGVARGSSTRGGVGAIVEMVRLMRAGKSAGFTVDGPKGPRYVAKMGPVILAKKTGNPILPFMVNPEQYWEVNSWDRFRVPKPFTRAHIVIAPPIFVPADAGDELLAAKRDELQQVLNALGED